MRPKYFQIVSFLLLTTSMILASCGGGGGGGGAAASLAMKGTSGNAVNMNGTWSGGCTYDTLNQENERYTLTLNGGSATFTTTVWHAVPNGNCTQTTTPDILFNGTLTATLSSDPTSTAIWVNGSGGYATAPGGIPATAKATKATLVFNSATVTVGTDLYVANLNNFNGGSGFCGQTNWVKGVPKNVLNCTMLFPTTTETDYWVVNDSAVQLKWYSGSSGTPWQVDNFDPMVK
jgi:hypothetical protein